MVHKMCVPLLGVLCVILNSAQFGQSAPQFTQNFEPLYQFTLCSPPQIICIIKIVEPQPQPQPERVKRSSDPENYSFNINAFLGGQPKSNYTQVPDDPPETTTKPKVVKKPRGKITLYPFYNRRGEWEHFVVHDSCVRLPKNWHDKVASVNTHDTCVQLCEKINCRGKCIRVQPGSPSHNRLRDIDWESRTVSLKPC